MTYGRQAHWKAVYAQKAPESVSWYQAHATVSMDLIAHAGTACDAHVVDVGDGASTLVDDLLASDFRNLSVLDMSGQALAASAARLGADAARVRWIEGDILELDLPGASIDLWHDRAVFHFLTEERDQAAYVVQARRSIRMGGHLVLATFAPEGPERCSGLPVRRYSAMELASRFSPGFVMQAQRAHVHRTPGGSDQVFVYCSFVRAEEP